MVRLFERKKTQDIEDREDGISIRSLKEQKRHVKSIEYKKLLDDCEHLKVLRSTRKTRKKEYMDAYNKERYLLEMKLNKLQFKKGDITTNFNPVKIDHIPRINLNGEIILPEK